MNKSKLKLLLKPIALFLSPFVVLAFLGIIYIAVMMIAGHSLVKGFDMFLGLINTLRPYFKYMTIIPVALIISINIIIRVRKEKRSSKDKE